MKLNFMKNNVLEKENIILDENNDSVFSSTSELPKEYNIKVYSYIGDFMKNIRIERRVDRKELAHLLKISYENLRDIENNKQFPSIKVSVLFCSLFSLNRELFLDFLLEKQLEFFKKTFNKNVKDCLDEFNLLAG